MHNAAKPNNRLAIVSYGRCFAAQFINCKKKKSFALYFNSWTLCYINGVGTESEKLTLSA